MIHFASESIMGQLSSLYSQYVLFGYVINPALAGFDGTESFNLTARQQWVGYDGNPKTYYFSYQNRILKKRFQLKGRGESLGEKKRKVSKTSGRVGVGFNLFDDSYGILHRTGGQYTYCYNIVLGRTGYNLSFGFSTFLYTLRIDQAKMILKDPVDPFITDAINRWTVVPDFAAGVNIRNNHYFAGISAGSLTQSYFKVFNSGNYEHYKPGRTYNFLAGWHMYETADLDIVPSVYFKMTEMRYLDTAGFNMDVKKFMLKPQVDVSLKTTIRDKFWIGFAYRSNNDAIGFIGFRYNHLFVSYCCDYPTSTIRYQNWCSHEISITYKLGTTDRREKWKERY